MQNIYDFISSQLMRGIILIIKIQMLEFCLQHYLLLSGSEAIALHAGWPQRL